MEEVQKREGLTCVCAECGTIIRIIAMADPAQHGLVSHGICPACAERLYGSIFRSHAAAPGSPPPSTARRPGGERAG
jgi:hypothetical protein